MWCHAPCKVCFLSVLEQDCSEGLTTWEALLERSHQQWSWIQLSLNIENNKYKQYHFSSLTSDFICLSEFCDGCILFVMTCQCLCKSVFTLGKGPLSHLTQVIETMQTLRCPFIVVKFMSLYLSVIWNIFGVFLACFFKYQINVCWLNQK